MKKLTHSARACRFAAFLTCAALIIAMICFLAVPEKDDSVYDSVLRLHIRANSDSEADQATKLAVRDALLPYTAALFADCVGLPDAVAVASDRSREITSHIDSALCSLGADYSSRIRLGREDFPERNYGGAVYPAGEYTALIVELGEGEGENWWCVLFPSLCLSASGNNDAVEAGLSPEQFEAIAPPPSAAETEAATEGSAPKYRLKFRFWELICSFFGE